MVLLQLQHFPKILKFFWTLLYFELVGSFLEFSLLMFGLWILKRLPALWVAVNRLVLSHFMLKRIPSLIEFIVVLHIFQSLVESGRKSLDSSSLRADL